MNNTLLISHVITEYLWIGVGWGEAIFKLQNGKRYLFNISFCDGTFRIHELEENSTEYSFENQIFDSVLYEDADSAMDFLDTLFTESEYDEIFEILSRYLMAYHNQSVEIFSEYSDKEYKNVNITVDQLISQIAKINKNK